MTWSYLHDGLASDLKAVVGSMNSYWVPKLNHKRLSPGDVEKVVEMLQSNTGVLKGEQL